MVYIQQLSTPAIGTVAWVTVSFTMMSRSFLALLALVVVTLLSLEVSGDQTCKLPAEVGWCKAKIRRYYFNSSSGKCQLFYYGGCKGNANNFKTRTECADRCEVQARSNPMLSDCNDMGWPCFPPMKGQECSKFAKALCAKSCGMCTDPLPECKDTASYCAANKDQICSIPDFAKEVCPKTCGKCPVAPSQRQWGGPQVPIPPFNG